LFIILDYKGEWEVVIHNLSCHNVKLQARERIAQFVIMSYGNFPLAIVDDIEETFESKKKRVGGFGSTN
jgi:dUTPase